MKKLYYSLLFCICLSTTEAQYISITNQATVYSEDFNTLAISGTSQSSLPNGWWIAELPGNFTYQAGTGSSLTGDTYGFGSTSNTDRALGGLASASNGPNFGVRYINNSGSAFSSFYFNLYMEQWRYGGGRTTPDSLYFYCAVNGNNDSLGFVRILNGTWTRYAAADMVSKVIQGAGGSLDGNSADNRQYYDFQITGLNVNPGDTLYLRWKDVNVSGSDDGLSIDDYSFSVSTPVPVKYTSFTAIKQTTSNLLKWSTASESNNSHFVVQRSTDGKNFESIARVKGNGNSTKIQQYTFTDASAPVVKTVYYRLKQVDFDGRSDVSKTVIILRNIHPNGINSTTPNPFNSKLNIEVNTTTAGMAGIELTDMIGKVQHTSTEILVSGSNTISVNTTNVPDGMYFVRVSTNGETYIQRVIKQ